MKKLILYSQNLLDKVKIPQNEKEKFLHLFKFFGPYATVIDRTNTISLPIQTENLFPIPEFRKFSKTYEELCNERAKEILEKAEKLDTKIYIMYSGGIDSTLVLVSFLKNANEEQKKRIVVLLSEESIEEYPLFYEKYIKGKLEINSPDIFKNLLGSKNILVTGDKNDLIFGGGILSTFIDYMGFEKLSEKYTREAILGFLDCLDQNKELNIFTMDILEKIAKKSPVELKTNMDFIWWISFVCKWQHSYYYMLRFTGANKVKNINKEYTENYYQNFFDGEEFQLWSMNNLDKRIKNTWESFKYICKDIIYSFTGDAKYRENKVKVVSLNKVYWHNHFFNFINSDLEFLNDINEDYYSKDNNFV